MSSAVGISDSNYATTVVVLVQNTTTLTSMVTVEASPNSSSEGGKFVALNKGTRMDIQTQLLWIGTFLLFRLVR